MRHFLPTVLLCLALVSTATTDAQAPDRSGTSGLAIGTALGSDNVMVGGYASYYLQVPESRWRFAMRAGAGVLPGTTVVSGPAGGVMALYGRRHRLVIDLHAAPMGYQNLVVYDTHLDTKTLYGIGLAVGWEWMTPRGFFMRANVGPAFVFLPPIYPTSDGFTISGNLLSLGYKLW